MIIISIVTLVLALLILILAWRGRVVARGWFCKKCRFDLAGLDLESPEARCPECGQGIYRADDRREILRRSSRLGLVVAGVLLLASVGILGFGVSGKTGFLFGLLPDSTVFWLDDLGVDEALDEIVVRVSKVPPTMSDAFLTRAIEDALAYQADQSKVWDPRWGEVLSVMFGNPVMSDEQMLQYLHNGMDMGAVIRDRVHQGASSVSMNHTMAYGRISAVNYNSTGYWYTIKATSGGVVGEEPRPMGGNGGMTTNLSIPNRVNGMSMSTNGKVEPTGVGFDVEPGTSVLVFVEYELILRKIGVVGTYRTEQSVLVVDQDEAIVPILKDPTIAQALCESIVISPVRVLEEIPEQADNFGLAVFAFKVKYDGLPASIALNVLIDLGDGELIKIGKLVQQGPSAEAKGSRVSWGMKPFETRESTPYAEVIARLIERGQVDVIFETDATLANSKPGIDEVLELSIRFEDIPVAVFAEEDSIRFLSRSPSTQSYKADNPQTWYEGICEPEE